MRTLLLTLLLAACTDPGATIPGTSTSPDGLRYTPDWDGVNALFDEACVACHRPDGTAKNMILRDQVHADVVFSTGRYVVPYDPGASALWRVLTGDLLDGDYASMPLGSPPLDSSWIDHVRIWIEDGAPVPSLAPDNDYDGFGDDVDCDDANPYVNPAATEICNGVDDDCNGTTDDAPDAPTWYPDADADTFGDADAGVQSCDPPPGYIALGGDCDDADPAFHPGAPETNCADPTDWNCDGATGLTDNDGDGYGACEECNDADPTMHPGGTEICNQADDDCNGVIDDNAIDAPTWHRDADGDGYGDANGIAIVHCAGTVGWVTNADDCNDADANVNPGILIDAADGLDNDCDGVVDEDYNVVSHAASIQPIWNANCLAPCHSGFNPSDGLNLSGSAWNDIVNVPSGDVPGMFRVTPGDPQNSYLWHKLNGTQLSVGGSGSDMPKTGPPLSVSELDLIEQWILDGALP